MVKTPFVSERAAWRALHGNTKAARKRLAEQRQVFREIFPKGQRESIRSYVQEWGRQANTGQLSQDYPHYLYDIHPRAFGLIAQFGINQKSYMWEKEQPTIYEEDLQPISRGCYFNARRFMQYTRDEEGKSLLVYVEGIVMGSVVPPMLHAWNTNGIQGRIAIDWTFYATATISRYLGVTLTEQEHVAALEILETASPDAKAILFNRENFPIIEPYLRKILLERRRQVRVAKTSQPT